MAGLGFLLHTVDIPCVNVYLQLYRVDIQKRERKPEVKDQRGRLRKVIQTVRFFTDLPDSHFSLTTSHVNGPDTLVAEGRGVCPHLDS